MLLSRTDSARSCDIFCHDFEDSCILVLFLCIVWTHNSGSCSPLLIAGEEVDEYFLMIVMEGVSDSQGVHTRQSGNFCN